MTIDEQIDHFKRKHAIVVDDLDRIVRCDAKNLRERSEIFARWSELQQRKCKEELAAPKTLPLW